MSLGLFWPLFPSLSPPKIIWFTCPAFLPSDLPGTLANIQSRCVYTASRVHACVCVNWINPNTTSYISSPTPHNSSPSFSKRKPPTRQTAACPQLLLPNYSPLNPTSQTSQLSLSTATLNSPTHPHPCQHLASAYTHPPSASLSNVCVYFLKEGQPLFAVFF